MINRITLASCVQKLTLFYLAILLIGAIGSCSTKNQTLAKESEAIGVLPAEGEFHFVEITEQAGLFFKHSIGDNILSNVVESVGGGAAFLDYDQDGFLDIYIVNSSFSEEFSEGEKPGTLPANALFHNLKNGRFEDATNSAGVGDTGFGMGVNIGDYDNDGYPDIYVSNYGPNILYHNNGNGTFTDLTSKAGVAGNACSIGAVWLDYDKDGWIDLYVGNYIRFDPKYNLFYAPDGFPGPTNFDGEPDVLYHNLGNGKFEDVTQRMGIFKKDGRAMGVGSADYDNDGFADIYVANDQMLNYLFHNDGGKGFTEVAIKTGVAFNQSGEATSSMGVDFGDYNGDGWIDLFVSDDSYSALYQNLGDGLFIDQSYQSGIAVTSGQFVGWSASFLDYDNDMDLDIFKVNGELQHLYGQEDQLFENIGSEKFRDVSVAQGSYFHKELVGRGACFGDYDNDGDLDAFINNLNDHPVLLRNDIGNHNNWLLIQLTGTVTNKDGIGTKVKIITHDKIQHSERRNANGYLSQNDPRMHFGLGRNEIVESIEVFWPSGKTQKLDHVKCNQILKIMEP